MVSNDFMLPWTSVEPWTSVTECHAVQFSSFLLVKGSYSLPTTVTCLYAHQVQYWLQLGYIGAGTHVPEADPADVVPAWRQDRGLLARPLVQGQQLPLAVFPMQRGNIRATWMRRSQFTNGSELKRRNPFRIFWRHFQLLWTISASLMP